MIAPVPVKPKNTAWAKPLPRANPSPIKPEIDCKIYGIGKRMLADLQIGPSSSSVTSSEDSVSVRSPISTGVSTQFHLPSGIISPPGLDTPTLGAPPGLTRKMSSAQSTSPISPISPPNITGPAQAIPTVWPKAASAEHRAAPKVNWGWPSTAVNSVEDADDELFPVADFGALAIAPGAAAVAADDPAAEDEVFENLWAEVKPLKTDWDKKICPTHKTACKPGICKVMQNLEAEEKRKAAAAEAGDGGWSSASSRGGRGGRGGNGQRGGRGNNGKHFKDVLLLKF